MGNLKQKSTQELIDLRKRIEEILCERIPPPETEYRFNFAAAYWVNSAYRPALARLVSNGDRLEREHIALHKRGGGRVFVRVGARYAARDGELIEEIECSKSDLVEQRVSIVSKGTLLVLWIDHDEETEDQFGRRALRYLNGRRGEFDEDLLKKREQKLKNPDWEKSPYDRGVVRAAEHLLVLHGVDL